MKLDQDLKARLYITSASRNKENKLKVSKKAKLKIERTKPDQGGTQIPKRKQGRTNHTKVEGKIPKEQNERRNDTT
jgi:hypothetical protein